MVGGWLGVVLKLAGTIFECILRRQLLSATYWWGGPASAGCSGSEKLFYTTGELTNLCIYNTPSPACGKSHP